MKKNIPLITDKAKLSLSIKVFSNLIDINDLNKLTCEHYSVNSLKSMVNDWNRFVEFCQLKQVSCLPASVSAIRIFLEKEAKSRKFASVRRYSLTLGTIHRLHSFPEPTNHRQIKLTLAQLRQDKQGDAKSANPFTKTHLDALFSLLSNSTQLKDIRDLAIYSIMFECAMKRSDLKELHFSAIRNDEGEVCVELDDHTYRLSEQSSLAVRRWLEMAQRQHGHAFCRIDRHGNLYDGALDDSSIYRVFRRASDLLNLSEELKFSGQSSRVGAAKALAEQGYRIKDIQDFGRWLSPAMPSQYLGRIGIADQEKMKFTRIKPWD